MRKLTALFAASALSLGVLVGIAGAVTAPNTTVHYQITHKKTQYFHIVSNKGSGTARCRRDGRAWYTCGLGGETLRNLSKGLHTFRAKAVYKGKADPTPFKKTCRVN